jgi:hypothetical protein
MMIGSRQNPRTDCKGTGKSLKKILKTGEWFYGKKGLMRWSGRQGYTKEGYEKEKQRKKEAYNKTKTNPVSKQKRAATPEKRVGKNRQKTEKEVEKEPREYMGSLSPCQYKELRELIEQGLRKYRGQIERELRAKIENEVREKHLRETQGEFMVDLMQNKELQDTRLYKAMSALHKRMHKRWEIENQKNDTCLPKPGERQCRRVKRKREPNKPSLLPELGENEPSKKKRKGLRC